MPTPSRTILFTAFEPSGDALASRVIAPLRRQRPDWRIIAMGGPKMHAAGAELIETTTENAAMLAGAFAKVREHAGRIGRLKNWLQANRIDVLIPTDSPAANWPICKAVRKIHPHAKIVHLAAPQLWAWAPWRISKLRRLTDRVLCILPFEEAYFSSRGVPATFVGHPIFDDRRDASVATENPTHEPASRGATQNGLHIALLPGSRPGEIRANWPTMLAAVERVAGLHPDLRLTVAAADEDAADLLRSLTPHWPQAIAIRTAQTEEVLAAADLALVVSGTATLLTLAHRVPLVTLYNVNRLGWHLVRPLIQTRTFTLPNLIAEAQGMGRIVPELVPHFGAIEPVEHALDNLVNDAAARQQQQAAFDAIIRLFNETRFEDTATKLLLHMVEA